MDIFTTVIWFTTKIYIYEGEKENKERREVLERSYMYLLYIIGVRMTGHVLSLEFHLSFVCGFERSESLLKFIWINITCL